MKERVCLIINDIIICIHHKKIKEQNSAESITMKIMQMYYRYLIDQKSFTCNSNTDNYESYSTILDGDRDGPGLSKRY